MRFQTLRVSALIGIISIAPFLLRAQQTSGPQALLPQQDKEWLFQQALAILPEERIPARYQDLASQAPPRTCATMVLALVQENLRAFDAEQRAALSTLFTRPNLPLSKRSASGRFRIHYADSGGDAVPPEDLDGNDVPDFIDEVERAFERSYDIQVNQMGYLPPPDDNGVHGPEYDVYAHNLNGSYGFTTSDGPASDLPQERARRSYIQIDNDFEVGYFTTGIPGAQVTAAHEFFHALQFAYRIFANNQEPFYYELCSVWMEDVVYDDINDYYQYLPANSRNIGFFRRTDVPFNRFDPFFHAYGQAVWNLFIVKKFGNADLIRRSWEFMQSNDLAMNAINQTLFEEGSSFADEFAEFAFWNYFTGSRADTVQFYDEGHAYPEIRLNGDFSIESDTTIVDSSLSATHKYYRFTTFVADAFLITGALAEPGNWRFGVIVTPPDGQISYRVFDLRRGLNLGFLPRFTEVVVIPMNIQVLDGDNLSRLTTQFSRFSFNLIRVPFEDSDERGFIAIYPNPFMPGKHNRLHAEFFAQGTEELEVRILSGTGRVVHTSRLTDGSGLLTPGSFQWDGKNEDDQEVPSGIYLIQLKQDDFVQLEKFAVVRE